MHARTHACTHAPKQATQGKAKQGKARQGKARQRKAGQGRQSRNARAPARPHTYTYRYTYSTCAGTQESSKNIQTHMHLITHVGLFELWVCFVGSFRWCCTLAPVPHLWPSRRMSMGLWRWCSPPSQGPEGWEQGLSRRARSCNRHQDRVDLRLAQRQR